MGQNTESQTTFTDGVENGIAAGDPLGGYLHGILQEGLCVITSRDGHARAQSTERFSFTCTCRSAPGIGSAARSLEEG